MKGQPDLRVCYRPLQPMILIQSTDSLYHHVNYYMDHDTLHVPNYIIANAQQKSEVHVKYLLYAKCNTGFKHQPQ